MVTLVLLSACGKQSSSDTSQKPSYLPGGVKAEPSVTLSASQRGAVKIAQVSLYLFRNEKEAVGSVGFTEDPSIVQSESSLLSAAAAYAVAEREWRRAKDLFSTNGVSKRELEQATSDYQTAAAALETGRNALRVLGKSDVEISRVIAAGRIEPPNSHRGSKWVVANVSEGDDPSLRDGQPVAVKVEAIGDHVFSGKITEIYAVVDPALHRVSVRAEVNDPNDQLRSGMLADVNIQVQKPLNSLSLPVNGVVREGDGTMTAWVTTDGQRFVQRHIETGAREDGRVQVLSGIRAGELVVTDGAVFLDNMLQAPAGD